MCAQCEELSKTDEVFCATCFELVKADRPSKRARMSVVLAVLGAALLVGFIELSPPLAFGGLLGAPIGLLGLSLALAERAAIARGDSKPSGKRWAVAGIGVGVLHALLTLTLAVLFAATVLRR